MKGAGGIVEAGREESFVVMLGCGGASAGLGKGGMEDTRGFLAPLAGN